MMLHPPLAVVDGFSFLCGKMLCHMSAICIVSTHLYLLQIMKHCLLHAKTTVTHKLMATHYMHVCVVAVSFSYRFSYRFRYIALRTLKS